MIGASFTMVSKRFRRWGCLASLYSRMASRKPGPVLASARELLGRLRRLLGLLRGHRGLRRITAPLHWVLRDPGLAAAVLLLDPGRLLRRLGIVAPRRLRLGVPTPAPAVGLARRAGLAEPQRMAPAG